MQSFRGQYGSYESNKHKNKSEMQKLKTTNLNKGQTDA